jgi:hypothetical protein
MATLRKNYTVASKASGEKEKKASPSNVGVALTPSANINAARSRQTLEEQEPQAW